MTDYGHHPSDFKPGDRVEVHPATDLWMMGARYGTVATIGYQYVHVYIDALNGRTRPHAISPQNVRKI